MTGNKWPVVELFCVDVSSSMKRSNLWGPASFLGGRSRYNQVKNFLKMNEKTIRGTNRYIGLVSFAETPVLLVPIMNERNWRNESFLDVLDTIKPKGDTNLFDSLELCYDCLKDFSEVNAKTKIEARIYVLTDGKDNLTPKRRKEDIIKKLGSSWDKGDFTEISNLIIVGFGSEESQENVRELSNSLPNSTYINHSPSNPLHHYQFMCEIIARSDEKLIEGKEERRDCSIVNNNLVHPITREEISLCAIGEKKRLVEENIRRSEKIINELLHISSENKSVNSNHAEPLKPAQINETNL